MEMQQTAETAGAINDLGGIIMAGAISDQAEADKVKALLEAAAKAYYESDAKLLSDNDYDLLNEAYERFTGEIVSGAKGTTSMSHGYDRMMSTLKKAKNMAELEDWLGSAIRDAYSDSFSLDKDVISLGLSHKMDGNSVLLEYVNGVVAKAVTRGKDGFGVDVTGLFADRTLPEQVTCGVKYEAMVGNSKMAEISRLRGRELVDARGAITGILGRDDAQKYGPYIDLFPLDISFGDDVPAMTRVEAVSKLYRLHNGGYCSCGFIPILGTLKEVVEQIGRHYDRNADARIRWEHTTDGMVIEFLDPDVRAKLGWHQGTSTYPKYARALKYPPYEMTTEALRMEFDVGPTGRITPCVVFKPVVIGGRTYQRTSISSHKRFQEMQLGEGTKMLFSLSGDVIGYVDKLNVPDNEQIAPWPFISVCPVCSHPLQANDTASHMYCVNPDCEAVVVGKLLKWVRKNGFKGIAESTLLKLVENGLLSNVPSLYDFVSDATRMEQAAQIEGLGKVSIANIAATIKGHAIKDYVALAVASPEGIGRTICKPVCRAYPIGMLVSMAMKGEAGKLMEMLVKIEGISAVNATKIIQGLGSPLMAWALVATQHITVEETYSEAKEEQKGGMNVCITGKLNSGSRDQLVARLEKAGHVFQKSVNAKTNVLVTNDPESGSDKNKKARQLGIDVWTEDELISRLGL